MQIVVSSCQNCNLAWEEYDADTTKTYSGCTILHTTVSRSLLVGSVLPGCPLLKEPVTIKLELYKESP